MVQEYLETDRAIRESKSSNPDVLAHLDHKVDAFRKLCQNIERLQKKCADFEVIDVAAINTDQSEDVNLNKQSSPTENSDQNRHAREMANEELKSALQQKSLMESELEDLKKRSEQLRRLLANQDKLLGEIFDGDYGSELENKLEQQLYTMDKQRTMVVEAHFKWRQAQVMLEFSTRQMAVSVQKWTDMKNIDYSDEKAREIVVTDVRNNLVASVQNIEGAQRYLSHVQFPYCSPQEIRTLQEAVLYIFIDMKTEERYGHALNCYRTSHMRIAALLQWIDQVLNDIIRRDLMEITNRVRLTSKLLRRERIRLIKIKAKETWDMDIEMPEDDFTEESEQADLSTNFSQVEVARTEQDTDSHRAKTPVKLSSKEIAPLPSNSTVFGNTYENTKAELQSVTNEYERELERYEQNNSDYSARIEQDLQNKLNQRRRNRSKLTV